MRARALARVGALALIFGCSSEPAALEVDAGAASADAGAAVADAGEDAGAGSLVDGGLVADAGSLDLGAADAGETRTLRTLGPAERPASMRVPTGYQGEALPLVVLLHGYTANAELQDRYFGLSARVDARRFFLLLPNGTRETQGARNRFWNATSACCDFAQSGVDDSGYLAGLIEAAQVEVSVSRVFLIGHSNGGFMSYRLACDRAALVDGLVSLAGSTLARAEDCRAGAPVRVLQVHGTADTTIPYEGQPGFYPSADEAARRWAERGGCRLDGAEPGGALDLDTAVAGAETAVTTYREGCAAGADASLWRMEGSGHIPRFDGRFIEAVLDWLFEAG